MPTIRKTRSIRNRLSPRYKGPVDAGGYTPEPRGLPDPALLEASLAKHDPYLQKALAKHRKKIIAGFGLTHAKSNDRSSLKIRSVSSVPPIVKVTTGVLVNHPSLAETIAAMRADSIRQGTDKLTLADINAEVAAVRTARRRRR